jgi:hypothetical protein
MAERKTQPTEQSVEQFLNSLPDPRKRQDCFALVELMKQVTQAEPVMWGSSIIGFGTYYYKTSDGNDNEWFLTGFSPRKQNLTLYIMADLEKYTELLKGLGKHKTAKSCLYINRLEDIDLPTLKLLLQRAIEYLLQANK